MGLPCARSVRSRVIGEPNYADVRRPVKKPRLFLFRADTNPPARRFSVGLGGCR